MALTVVPEQKSTGQIFAQQLATGLGGELGKTAAKGIGAGLGALGTGLGQMTGLIEKPKQLTEDILIKAGFTPEDAKLIVNAPPALQAKLIDAISQREPAEMQQPSQTQEQPQEMPQEGEQPNQEGADLVHPNAQRIFDEVAKESQGKRSESRPSALFRAKKETPEDKRVRLAEEGLAFKKEQAEKKNKFEESKEERKEVHLAEKESKPYYDTLKTKVRDARDNNMRLSKQKEKIKEGKLVGPGLYKLLKRMDIPLDPDSAEFEKLTNDYLKNAKSVFGSRLTDMDLKTFLTTVPSLETSDTAKSYVINNLELFNEAVIAEDEAMRAIIKENGGRRPRNLEDLVEERTKDIKDDIAKRFKEGLKDIPEETTWERVKRVATGPVSSAIGTGGGALIGGLIGGPAGAGVGATLGSGALGSIGKALGKLAGQ